ncbi:AAA family ATPase [Methylobacterium aerolatum]|uniref:AAA+ ATPase domain-containing protein n=1 Tax=Methylobacterium aerolatum TaxID=418708 RepID=A0ABU0I023_9HYPH|nr:AAA family ATPase [Methylobacterium aerolatum]MDQ0447059.1 hypothetical protein [Methylobacterium aerolatum]GJD37220.1 ATP-dependent zinc metalloprotease FtsH [Methylobacterium aerolatum]
MTDGHDGAGGAGNRRPPGRKTAGAARTFLAALGRPTGTSTMDEAIDELRTGPRVFRADLVGATVALGDAVDAAGGTEALPRRGPAIVLVEVPSQAWVRSVAAVAASCLCPVPGSGVLPGHLPCLVLDADGTRKDHAPGTRNAEVSDALMEGEVVIGVSQDPGRYLPADLVRGADVRLELSGLDRDGLAEVVRAVTGARPAARLPEGLATRCDPADLALSVHPGRGTEGSWVRLAGILEGKLGRAEDGPRVHELHGYGAARDWGIALVADLAAWRRGGRDAPRWRDIESAILLSGPPGVGKTAFAAALARSAGVPLLAGSLGLWQSARDGHLGHTLGAMRAFFEEARRAPCVALIDELDSFGDRAAFGGEHRDYSTQVVNALLEHLSGATPREGVVVVGATNAPDRIDPAILRSGRLERHVRIDPPDEADRARILGHYLGGELPGLDLRRQARNLAGMTGADIEALVRRARGAARRAGRTLDRAGLAAAADEARPAMPVALRHRISVHEAGHLVAALATGAPGPLAASLDPGGGYASVGADDGAPGTEAELDDRLVVLLAGRAAEANVFGDVTAGAAWDLAAATELALAMETRFGFSRRTPLVARRGPVDLDPDKSPATAHAVEARLSAAYERAGAIVSRRRAVLDDLARALLRRAALDDAGIRRIADGPNAPGSRNGGKSPRTGSAGRFRGARSEPPRTQSRGDGSVPT